MIYPLSTQLRESVEVIGAKAHGLVTLLRLGLPVPPGFVLGMPVRPEGLDAALTELETATGRQFGDPDRPLAVSVRSGGIVSMPGMMATILDVGDRREVERAVAAVVSSWDTARARTYRQLNGIPHDLGTAVIVQAMVYGDRDVHSGSGVAFNRDPITGEQVPYGDVLFGHQGDAVASGRGFSRPLRELADREPAAWIELLDAMARVEDHYRDAGYLEFTVESGRLWLLQARPGRFVGEAAIRVAVELADAGIIDRREALLRMSTQDLTTTERIASGQLAARGVGASPGVAIGVIASTVEAAIRLAPRAILVRPETSPLDLPGLAAAAGVVTARGGPASHAAVVARAMGKPAVVGIADLTVLSDGVEVAGRTLPEAAVLSIDGTSGEVFLGAADVVSRTASVHRFRLLEWADAVSGDRSPRPDAQRLLDAQAASGRR